MSVSERRACTVLAIPRSTQRYKPTTPDDEAVLVKRMLELALKYGRYGYLRITGLLRNEVLNREVFDTLLEAKVLVERWRREYNHIRPHSALGYRPPAPEAILPADESLDPLLFGSASLHLTTTAG